MNINKAKEYIEEAKIILEGFDEEVSITLREPTMIEFSKFQKNIDKVGEINSMIEMLPTVLIDHSFTDDDGSKSANKDVIDFLKQRSTLLQNINECFINFYQPKKKTTSTSEK